MQPTDSTIRLNATTQYDYRLHSLREPGLGVWQAEWGSTLAAGSGAAVSVDFHSSASTIEWSEGNTRHIEWRKFDDTPGRMKVSCELAGDAPTGTAQWQGFRTLTTQAIERRCAIELGRRYEAAATGDLLLKVDIPEGAAPRCTGGALAEALAQPQHVELQLPFVPRKLARRPDTATQDIRVECDASGILRGVGPESRPALALSDHQNRLALATVLTPPESQDDFHLTFNDQRTFLAGAAPAALDPLLRYYRFKRCVREWLQATADSNPQAPVRVLWTLRIRAAHAAAWGFAPGELDPLYLQAYGSVSRAIQRSMRRWLPYQFFEDVSRLSDHYGSWPLLVYQSTRHFPPKSRSELTYDVLNTDSLNYAFAKSSLHLQRLLRRLRDRLAGENRLDLLPLFYPRHEGIQRVLDRTFRERRRIMGLFAGEHRIVDEWTRFGCAANAAAKRLKSDPKKAVRAAADGAERCTSELYSILKRLYPGHDATPLASLFLVEATAALSNSLGRPAPIEAILTLETEEGQYVFVSEPKPRVLKALGAPEV